LPQDADFLQKAFSVIEDDPKRLKRHLAVAASATASAEEVIEACEEIRELVEQIDNACDLAPLGGWPVLVSLLGGRPASAPAGGAAGAAGAGSSAVLASEAPIGASTHATDEGVRAATLACVRAAVANNPRGLVAAAHCGTVRPVVDILVAANTCVGGFFFCFWKAYNFLNFYMGCHSRSSRIPLMCTLSSLWCSMC
jgi:hypothetical protein